MAQERNQAQREKEPQFLTMPELGDAVSAAATANNGQDTSSPQSPGGKGSRPIGSGRERKCPHHRHELSLVACGC